MAIMVIVVLVLLFFSIHAVVDSRQYEKRLQGYTGLTLEDFVDHFAADGVPASVSGAVYETFKKKVKAKTFKPSPDMSIEGVFEQLGEDTDDDARHILKLIGIPNPTDESRESWPGKDVITIADMVLWTDWVRRHQEPVRNGSEGQFTSREDADY